VWDSFDRRKAAKLGPVANEDGEGEDMFARAGVAAE
jgi:ribonucleoside-diphosphate reductase beta chain